jgi:anti-sigma regulatory factor (Ser/Thr protein kinase)
MNALIVEREGASREFLTKDLERLGFANISVDWPYRGVEYLKVQSFDLCVINLDCRLDLRRFLRLMQEVSPQTKILFISEKRSSQHYGEVLGDIEAKHLVSKSISENIEWIVPRELFEHTVSLAMRPEPETGLKSLFPLTQVMMRPIKGTSDKNELFDQVEVFAKSYKLRGRVVQNIIHLTDELVMNTIFNAPRTRDGQYKYRDSPRDSQIHLSATEQGKLEYAYDGQFFGLSAEDPFGALKVGTVREYLTRSYGRYKIADGQFGGGMGFLNMFSFASYFEVLVAPKKLTRVTVLVNAKQGMRQARAMPRSFNLIELNNRAV